jgi:DNA-binding transcriptional LysR family regulator
MGGFAGRTTMKAKVFDTRQLQAFAALARLGSFTLAAHELHLTQSAISHAIKALEEQAGCRLFDRSGRRVTLTQAGEQLLRHVDKILAEMKTARLGLEELSRWGHGRLRLGASTTACQYILPGVLREFKQSFPKCVITIDPGDHGQQVELLLQNRVDLAIMLEPADNRELAFSPLFDDEMRFLLAPVHPWAKAGRASRADFAEQTLILYNQTSYTFRLVKEYFRAEGLPLANYLELGSMEAIKELAKVGLGIGVLAPWVARAELESGALVSLPLGKRKLRRRWGVAYLRGRRLSLGEETFVGLCQTVTGEFAGQGGAAA